MKPQSSKAKGRKLQQLVRDLLLGAFPSLHSDDVRSTSMGTGGEDIQLSPAARMLFPFAVECKNTEKLAIWDALEQAEANSKGNTPLLVFKRNRSKVYACLELSELIKLVKG